MFSNDIRDEYNSCHHVPSLVVNAVKYEVYH